MLSSSQHLHYVRHLTVHVDYRLCFVTDFASLDHCMSCTGCDTDPLNQCQGEVLRYMHCTHTTAHSMTLSSTMTAWLKSL